MKLDADQFRSQMQQVQPSLFVSCSSFEERCLAASSIVADTCECVPVLFCTDRLSERSNENLRKLVDIGWKKAPDVVKINISDPLATFDAMAKRLAVLSKEAMRSIVVDISTFTHEHLAILIRVLHTQNLLNATHFAYVSVCTYGDEDETKHLWLSRGAVNIRPIVGFPGMLRPSRPLHLIALVGFEFERAQVAIEESEPSFVSLGVGERCESVTFDHHGKNHEFYSRLMDFVEERLNTAGWTQRFEFSCISPTKAQQQILDVVGSHPDHNVVLFPMNTKISTLGAVMAALANPSIQLGYVEPVEYNIDKYSQGIDGFRLFHGSDFLTLNEASTLLCSP